MIARAKKYDGEERMKMIERKRRKKKKENAIEKEENRCSFRPSIFPSFVARSFLFVIDELEALVYASRRLKAEVEGMRYRKELTISTYVT